MLESSLYVKPIVWGNIELIFEYDTFPWLTNLFGHELKFFKKKNLVYHLQVNNLIKSVNNIGDFIINNPKFNITIVWAILIYSNFVNN